MEFTLQHVCFKGFADKGQYMGYNALGQTTATQAPFVQVLLTGQQLHAGTRDTGDSYSTHERVIRMNTNT